MMKVTLTSDIHAVASSINVRSAAFTRPFIVAIDGRSGTGKSTFAAALAKHMNAVAIDGDDFYQGGTGIATDPLAKRASRCIDWRAQRTVLTTLRAGRSAAYHPFDWNRFDGNCVPAEHVVPSSPLILLEGVYSARPELADLLDFRILLQASAALRHERLLCREGAIGEWERRWHEAEDWYFANCVPIDGFDLVIEALIDDGDREARRPKCS
ncbi:uridine kinase [Sphingomonas sp. BE138]|uniref:uridine kinase family protein n=1 Tax=Sphingomonas sp. BE138 TaxID=2817845 RepID=UPI0028653B85|nr:hypothetical protein [Sphingomonas sp. BE138]MDR6790668.1 uridine kinase [Sphingomonas sp. BE138]